MWNILQTWISQASAEFDPGWSLIAIEVRVECIVRPVAQRKQPAASCRRRKRLRDPLWKITHRHRYFRVRLQKKKKRKNLRVGKSVRIDVYFDVYFPRISILPKPILMSKLDTCISFERLIIPFYSFFSFFFFFWRNRFSNKLIGQIRSKVVSATFHLLKNSKRMQWHDGMTTRGEQLGVQ